MQRVISVEHHLQETSRRQTTGTSTRSTKYFRVFRRRLKRSVFSYYADEHEGCARQHIQSSGSRLLHIWFLCYARLGIGSGRISPPQSPIANHNFCIVTHLLCYINAWHFNELSTCRCYSLVVCDWVVFLCRPSVRPSVRPSMMLLPLYVLVVVGSRWRIFRQLLPYHGVEVKGQEPGACRHASSSNHFVVLLLLHVLVAWNIKWQFKTKTALTSWMHWNVNRNKKSWVQTDWVFL